jgi:hypothetical protein
LSLTTATTIAHTYQMHSTANMASMPAFYRAAHGKAWWCAGEREYMEATPLAVDECACLNRRANLSRFLIARKIRCTQSRSVAGLANAVHLNWLSAATIAGRAVAANNAADAAAVVATDVLGAPNEADSQTDGAIARGHSGYIQRRHAGR